MKNQSVHSVLLALVGGYILYIAYQLFDSLHAGEAEMPVAMAIAAITFFALAGVAVLLYAWKVWKDSRREEEEKKDGEMK